MNESQICNDCLRDTGYKAFGTVVAGDEPETCDCCGNEFWKLNLVDLAQQPDEADRDPAESEDDYLYMTLHQIGGGLIE